MKEAKNTEEPGTGKVITDGDKQPPEFGTPMDNVALRSAELEAAGRKLPDKASKKTPHRVTPEELAVLQEEYNCSTEIDDFEHDAAHVYVKVLGKITQEGEVLRTAEAIVTWEWKLARERIIMAAVGTGILSQEQIYVGTDATVTLKNPKDEAVIADLLLQEKASAIPTTIDIAKLTAWAELCGVILKPPEPEKG